MKHLRSLVLVIFVGFAVSGCKENISYIGIMSAMDVELNYLVSKLDNEKKVEVAGVSYHLGKLEGKDVVLVKSGIGKTLSASVASILIEKFKVNSIIFTGVAGGVSDAVKITDIVISTQVMQHDYGFYGNDGKITVGGDFLPKLEATADANLVEKAYKSAITIKNKDSVFKGLIATGDQFMANTKYVEHLSKDFGALAVEMEGGSVGYVAAQAKIPFVIIRSMSDKADGIAHSDYENWYKIVADNSAKIVLDMLKNL